MWWNFTVKCAHVYRFDCDYELIDLVNYRVLRNNVGTRAANTMNTHGGHEYSRCFFHKTRLGESKPRLVRENTVSVELRLMIILPILRIAVEQNHLRTVYDYHIRKRYGSMPVPRLQGADSAIQNHIVSPLIFRRFRDDSRRPTAVPTDRTRRTNASLPGHACRRNCSGRYTHIYTVVLSPKQSETYRRD